MALPSDPAFASLAVACAVLFGVAFASVRGWIRPNGPTHAGGVIVCMLLATNAFFLFTGYAPVAAVPERWLGWFPWQPRGKAAVAADADRPLMDGEHVWLLLHVIAGCVLGCVVVAVFRAYVGASQRRRRRRRTPPRLPGMSGRTGRRATGCGGRTLVELVLFLVSVWACVYCFPGVAGDYIAATAKGGDPAAPA